jgi:hypothetical protein
MQKIMYTAIIVIATIFTACNGNADKKTEPTATTTTDDTQLYACSMHPEITGKKDTECSKCGMKLTVPVKQQEKDTSSKTATTIAPLENKAEATTAPVAVANFSIADIVSNYIKMKNALTKDDAKSAADAGKAIVVAMAKLDVSTLDAAKKKAYMDVADDAKENSQHIGDNAGKIDHQREHFAMLSKDIADLVKTFDTGQKLYQDYCPMYDDGKGAIWISEIKEIKNPYFGSKMLTCGSMKKEL